MTTARAHTGTHSLKLVAVPNQGASLSVELCGKQTGRRVNVVGRTVSVHVYLEAPTPFYGVVTLAALGYDARYTHTSLSTKIEGPPLGQWLRLQQTFADNGTEGTNLQVVVFPFSGSAGPATAYIDDLRFE